MPLGRGALEIGERHKLGHSLREKRRDRAYILPNSFKSVLVPLFAGILHHIGWYGEMRYGPLDNACVSSEEAWSLMVEHYMAPAYDKDMILTAKNLPQPLLQPQLQVSGDKKSLACNQFSPPAERPIIDSYPGVESGLAEHRPHYHHVEPAKQLTDEGYQIVLFDLTKDHEASNEILVTLSVEQQAWCRNPAGETQLEQVVVLLIACKAVTTNDSGLTHVVTALNRSLVVLYGPNNPDFAPLLSHKTRVIRLTTGYRKVRRGDAAEGHHQSLIGITLQYVLEELNDLLLQEEA